jgi:hypothetical protein
MSDFIQGRKPWAALANAFGVNQRISQASNPNKGYNLLQPKTEILLTLILFLLKTQSYSRASSAQLHKTTFPCMGNLEFMLTG